MTDNSVTDTDRGYRDIVKALGGLDGAGVFVGVRQAAGAQRHPDGGATMLTIAAANEFGVPGRIPERSFLRSTADENAEEYGDEMGDAIVRVMGGSSLGTELGRVGQRAVRDVQVKMRNLKDPPNAPSTIKAKGSSNPLIDTGRLRQSIDYEVRAAGGRVLEAGS